MKWKKASYRISDVTQKAKALVSDGNHYTTDDWNPVPYEEGTTSEEPIGHVLCCKEGY